MVQESKCNIAVVGGGPAGCFCAYNLQDKYNVTVFEARSPLATLLATGGGRCNLAHCEYDFRELAKNYPRGEKFLYSVFSKFGTADTQDFFAKIGVDTYVQDDMRIFPVSNSAVDVRDKFLKSLHKTKFIEEKVTSISPDECGFSVITDKCVYHFDKVILSVGGHAGFELAKICGHNIITPKPALTGLKTKENLAELSGVCVKNSVVSSGKLSLCGDMMFTHTGVTGPVIYKMSSLKARDSFPYNIAIDFVGEIDFQNELNSNPHKNISNLLADFLPKSLAEYILRRLQINSEMKSHKVDGKTRDKIINEIQNFNLTVTGTRPDGEVVTSGGVDLNEVNPKNMESKIVSDLYFCGEVLDIDGFCGGFNLQNCWSTAYVAAQGIINIK